MPELTPEQIRQSVAAGMRDALRENRGEGGGGGAFGANKDKFSGPNVTTAIDKGVGEAAGLVEKAFSNTTPTLTGFSGQLADLTEKLGTEGLAKTVRSFGSTLDSNLGVFRALSGSGIDLGESLMSAQLAAGKARLPLDVFGKTVQQNSFLLAQMGGTATQGAQRFAEISGMIMSSAGKDLAKLGFTMDDIAEGTATYLELMTRGANARKLSDEELAAGAIEYNMEMDKLAKATGIQRKALDEANARAARDAQIQLALQKLKEQDPTGKMAAAYLAEIEKLKSIDSSGKLAGGVASMVLSGGNIVGKEAAQVALMYRQNGVDITKITRDMYEGQAGSVDRFREANDQAAAAAQERVKDESVRKLAGVQFARGEETMLTMQARMAMRAANSTEAYATAQQEQANRIKSQDPTRMVTGLDQTLTEVQNSFKKSLIESGVLDKTAVGMNYAALKAEDLADKFSALEDKYKYAAVAGTGVASELLSLGTAGAGLATYGGAKIYDKYKREQAGVDREGREIGPKKTPLGAAMKTGGAVLKKLLKLGTVIYAIYEITDHTGVREVIVEQGKEALLKPEDERGPTIEQKRAIDLERLKKGVMTPAQPERPPAQPERPPAAVPAFQQQRQQQPPVPPVSEATVRQTQTASAAATETRTQVEALNEAARRSDLSGLIIPENVSVSLENGNTKLRELKTNIMSTSTAFSELNNVNMDKLIQSLTQLNENMTRVTQGSKPFDGKPQGTEQATAQATPATSADKDMIDLLNQLNMNMGRLVSHQSEAVDYLSKTAKNTRNAVGNML